MELSKPKLQVEPKPPYSRWNYFQDALVEVEPGPGKLTYPDSMKQTMQPERQGIFRRLVDWVYK